MPGPILQLRPGLSKGELLTVDYKRRVVLLLFMVQLTKLYNFQQPNAPIAQALMLDMIRVLVD
jgi:hypothetical protein